MNKKKRIVILAGILILVLVGIIVFLSSGSRELSLESSPIPLSKLEIELSDSGELSFSAEIKKGELLRLLENENRKLHAVVDIASRVLPETMDVSGKIVCIKTEEKSRVFKFQTLSIGGYKLPEKLLAGMGEFHLDFKRSLVYNE